MLTWHPLQVTYLNSIVMPDEEESGDGDASESDGDDGDDGDSSDNGAGGSEA
jgi:hypothetical protein